MTRQGERASVRQKHSIALTQGGMSGPSPHPSTSNLRLGGRVAQSIGTHLEKELGSEVHLETRRVRAGLSLNGLGFRKLVSGVWASSNEDDIIDRAAELAYYFLFSLFPALIFLSAMFSVFASTRTQSDLELMLYLGKVIPPGAFTVVQSTFAATTAATATKSIVFGAIAALWSATYGMSSAQTTLNVVYHVRETRPYWKAKLIALVLTLAIFALVFSAMLLLLLGDYLMKLVLHIWLVNSLLEAGWKVVQVVASIFLMDMVFSITYHWGPDRKEHKWRWISPGAVVGTAGWLAVSIGFRLYLHFFNTYARLYGSVGTVIVLLTWFYISGLMLLLGAEINANIERAGKARLASS